MNFVKKLFLGSAIALSTFGLVACGGDSSSNADDEGTSSSSAEELVLSSVSETSPLAKTSRVTASRTSDGNGGYILTLEGSIGTDDDGFVTPDYEGDDPVAYMVDSISFDVGRKENGTTIRVANLPVPLKPNFTFPKNQFGLVFAIDEIPLDQKVIGCGDFVLYITVYMSGDSEDTKKYAFTARLDAEFDLPCAADPTSSSAAAATCTQLTSVEETLSNISTEVGGKTTINFAGGTSAHAKLSVASDEAYLEGESGVSFYEIDSYDDEINRNGMFSTPEDPVCLEKFEYSNVSKPKVDMLESMKWYMAETPDGIFPVRTTRGETSGNEGKIIFIYYKKTN